MQNGSREGVSGTISGPSLVVAALPLCGGKQVERSEGSRHVTEGRRIRLFLVCIEGTTLLMELQLHLRQIHGLKALLLVHSFWQSFFLATPCGALK